MKLIAISQGRFAKVDDEDWEALLVFKWQYTGRGYARRTVTTVGGTQVISYMHREILNAPPDKQVDHINGDRLDNQKTNLRLCSRAENARNRVMKFPGTSKYKGVYWCKIMKKYRARIQTRKGSKSLGHFEKEEDAAVAYNRAAVEYFGEFANLNVIGE